MSGAVVHAPCVNKSVYLTTIYGTISILVLFTLVSWRKSGRTNPGGTSSNGEFSDLMNFTKRVSIAVEQLRILIRIRAFRFTGRTKTTALGYSYPSGSSEKVGSKTGIV